MVSHYLIRDDLRQNNQHKHQYDDPPAPGNQAAAFGFHLANPALNRPFLRYGMVQPLHLAEWTMGNMRLNRAVGRLRESAEVIINQQLDHLIVRYPGGTLLIRLASSHTALHSSH